MTATTTRTGHLVAEAQAYGAGAGLNLPADQLTTGAHVSTVGGDQCGSDTPKSSVPADQRPLGTHVRSVGGDQTKPDTHERDVPADQDRGGTQVEPVGGDRNGQQTASFAKPILAASAGPDSPQPKVVAKPKTDPAAVGEVGQQQTHGPLETHLVSGPLLFDPALATLAASVDDLQAARIQHDNRLRALTTGTKDGAPSKDGLDRGHGLTLDHPAIGALAVVGAQLGEAEKSAVKALEKQLRRHPLYPWVKAQKGVGDKTMARLLGVVGDPYWADATFNEDGTVKVPAGPRTVSRLWALCGLHTLPLAANAPPVPMAAALLGGDPPASQGIPEAHRSFAGGSDPAGSHSCTDTHSASAARRRKGVRSNWNTRAKTAAWCVIEPCMKQLDPACKTDTGVADHNDGCRCSPYRIIVDKRRKHTAQTHPDWAPAHSLNDGMRIATKELLKHLWTEARDYYGRAQQ